MTFPVLDVDKINDLEKYVEIFANHWVEIIKTTKEQVNKEFSELIKDGKTLYQILIDRAIEKLYELLKKEKLLPDEANLKVLFAEELRKTKFEDWVLETF